MILDSHFHLTAMKERGLSIALPDSFLGLEVAIRGGDMKERIALRGGRRDVFLSAGAGPWVLEREDFRSVEEETKRVEEDILLYGADAIGECGFDNHWGYGTKEAQRELFLLEAELAAWHHLPLIIHTRDADEEMKEVIPLLPEKVIMHCYSSDKSLMYRLLDRGAYISFSGNVTYRANTLIQECAVLCPKERILYETDAPYLSPVPMRRELNRPEFTEYTLDFLSSLRKEDKDELKESVKRNFLSLMEHPESVVRG